MRRVSRSSARSGDYWDGVDRRQAYDDRRDQNQGQFYQPQGTPVDAKASTATLTLKEIGSIVVFVIGVAGTVFSAWNNLNRELDLQQNNFAQFKEHISKDVDGVVKTIDELKKNLEKINDVGIKNTTALDARIQELDASVAQLYQKLREKNTK